MKRTLRRASIALLGLLALVIAAFVPVVPGSVTYRSVRDSASQLDPTLDQLVSAHEAGVESHELYALRDGELHLRCMSTRHALVLVTGVSTTYWSLDDLESLRAAHPELEPHWPDPTARDAGVAWIPNSRERDKSCFPGAAR